MSSTHCPIVSHMHHLHMKPSSRDDDCLVSGAKHMAVPTQRLCKGRHVVQVTHVVSSLQALYSLPNVKFTVMYDDCGGF